MTSPTKNVNFEVEETAEAPKSRGCGIIGRYPVLSVLFFAACGIGLGLGLSFWVPEDANTKDTVIQWVGLIGDLFIRALKAVVLPLVFVNVILSVVDMMSVGRASSVGGITVGVYLLTTLVASIFGLISIIIFQPMFGQGDFEDSGITGRVQLGCDGNGTYLTGLPDGSVECMAGAEDMSYFYVEDVDATFSTKGSSGPANDISMSDTMYNGLFMKLVTSNIFESFMEANFAAVVVFAIAIGAAFAKVLRERNVATADSILFSFLKEIDAVLNIVINWVIACTPFAVFSLIAKAIGSQDNLQESFANVGFLVLATALAMLAHYIFIHHGLYLLMTRKNSLSYHKYLVNAQTTAFACSSSAATIPVTLACVEKTGLVPEPIAKFVIPLGATVNMDGGAIYFPCACIWLAVLNGMTPTAGNYIMLSFLATVGSMGTAPVPSASLVLIITAYNTVFGTTGTPEGFSFILAIDWFMDRLRTVMNVTGDAVVAGIVSHKCGGNPDGPLASTTRDGSETQEPVDTEVADSKAVSGSSICEEEDA